MELKDLHNPDKITAVLTQNDGLVEADTNDQGWQFTKKRAQLWQKLSDVRLFMVKQWNKWIASY